MNTLKEFIEFAATRASLIFNKTGELLPMYHAVSSDGENYIFPVPPGNKDESAALTRAYLNRIEATRVAFMAEAWTLTGKIETTDLDKIGREGVAAQPNRIEAIVLLAEDFKEGSLMASREIIRSGEKKPVLGALKYTDMNKAEGRLIGLLPKKGYVQ